MRAWLYISKWCTKPLLTSNPKILLALTSTSENQNVNLREKFSPGPGCEPGSPAGDSA